MLGHPFNVDPEKVVHYLTQMGLRSDEDKASSESASTVGSGSPSMNQKEVEGSAFGKGCPELESLIPSIAVNSIDSTNEVNWEVLIEKSDTAVQEPWGRSVATNAWCHSEIPHQGFSADGGNERKSGEYCAWNTDSQRTSSGGKFKSESISTCDSDSYFVAHQSDDDSDTDDGYDSVENLDDDISDDYDSDASPKTHEMQKKNRWFMHFFETMDNLAVEQINEQNRRWQCPACHDGPGAIAWYKGLQPLVSHAWTKRSSRVKLHRKFAALLEEELRRRTSVKPFSEGSGKLKDLFEPMIDHEIVWPPMIVITNNLLKKDDTGKWLGMGNQELCEYFNEYAVVKARKVYGPNGYQGTSVLIFEDSAMGYWEAERLHKHFIISGRDKDSWERGEKKCYPGAENLLYGYLACKEDVDIFNRHFQGKSCLKFGMRSYHQMVVVRMKQMNEENKTLSWLKRKLCKQQQYISHLEEILESTRGKVNEKMEEENTSVRCTEEMDTRELVIKEHDGVCKALENLPEEGNKSKLGMSKEREDVVC